MELSNICKNCGCIIECVNVNCGPDTNIGGDVDRLEYCSNDISCGYEKYYKFEILEYKEEDKHEVFLNKDKEEIIKQRQNGLWRIPVK